MIKDDVTYFYERNPMMSDTKANCLYHEIVSMTPDEWHAWQDYLRETILTMFNEHGCPPTRVGKTESEIIDNFSKLETFPVRQMDAKSDGSDDFDVINYTFKQYGTCVDQFFPTMVDTRINMSAKDSGHSIMDIFRVDKKFEGFRKGTKRQIRKDSMCSHSQVVRPNTKGLLREYEDGKEFIEHFLAEKDGDYSEWGVWFSDHVYDQGGYMEGKHESNELKVHGHYLKELYDAKKLDYSMYSNLPMANEDLQIPTFEDRYYTIRLYSMKERVFPGAFRAIRVGYVNNVANFPPLVAKYIYERFTHHCKDEGDKLHIYDPSSGWGGRILGAMSVDDAREVHYIGNDPNTDNHFDDGTTRYQYVAEFYNNKVKNPFFSNIHSYEIFKGGSEVIGDNPDFQKHKGKLDLVFTSPPYFNREAYSEDPEQSYKKFSNYDSWRDGFLRPTLTTAYEYLKPGRFILWNIADVLGLPLEDDSVDIINELGGQYLFTLKMTMGTMPGGHRLDAEGKPTTKNCCQIDGKWVKFEPVFVFYKPHADEAYNKKTMEIINRDLRR